MNIAATVIIYNPDKSVIANINSYSSFVKKLFIIDNSEVNVLEITDEIEKIERCEYLHDGENRGIAFRLNQACKLAILEGYEYLLTMDQDSTFSTNNINNYFNCINNFPKKEEAAMFAVGYTNPNEESAVCRSIITNEIITSGSIINLSLFPIVGDFDENLFIDAVDSEYCYRASTLNYLIVQFTNIFLMHKIGTVSNHSLVFFSNKTPRMLHSPLRLYYMTRNFLYVKSKYKKSCPQSIKHSKEALLNRLKNNFLFNKQKLLIAKYVLRAIVDFNKGNMGKYK